VTNSGHVICHFLRTLRCMRKARHAATSDGGMSIQMTLFEIVNVILLRLPSERLIAEF